MSSATSRNDKHSPWLIISSGEITGPFESHQIETLIKNKTLSNENELIPNFGFPFKLKDKEMLLTFFPHLQTIKEEAESTKTLFITKTHRIRLPKKIPFWIFLLFGTTVGILIIFVVVLRMSF